MAGGSGGEDGGVPLVPKIVFEVDDECDDDDDGVGDTDEVVARYVRQYGREGMFAAAATAAAAGDGGDK